ncbi:MAG TPA: hypothetical protein VKX17_26005 [Planctomycetota bacterium]|nr:hypothetical protein [Planctomycetota bacterium]
MTNSEILTAARQAAKRADNWMDFSDFVFHPFFGLLAKAFPEQKKRAAFYKSPECEEITKLLAVVIDRDESDNGSAPNGVSKKQKHKKHPSKAASHARIPHR